MSQFKTQIKNFIGNGKLDDALKYAKTQALLQVPDLDTPVTLINSEFVYLKEQYIKGLLTEEDVKVQRQKLSNRLLMAVEETYNEDEIIVGNASSDAANKEVILFLGANPFKKLVLELDREIEEISEGLKHFGKRHAFDFRAKLHVKPVDLQRMMLESEYTPRFVHFAGNAVVNHAEYGSGVVFEDDYGNPKVVKGEVLATLFKKYEGLECVFLNTCDSGPFALAIGQHIKYAIGMNDMILDICAITFAVGFYESIASGRTIPLAFEDAIDRLRLEHSDYPEQANIPILVVEGVCKQAVYIGKGSHLDC